MKKYLILAAFMIAPGLVKATLIDSKNVPATPYISTQEHEVDCTTGTVISIIKDTYVDLTPESTNDPKTFEAVFSLNINPELPTGTYDDVEDLDMDGNLNESLPVTVCPISSLTDFECPIGELPYLPVLHDIPAHTASITTYPDGGASLGGSDINWEESFLSLTNLISDRYTNPNTTLYDSIRTNNNLSSTYLTYVYRFVPGTESTVSYSYDTSGVCFRKTLPKKLKP